MATLLQPSIVDTRGTSMTADATKQFDAYGYIFGPVAPQERPNGGGMMYQHHNLPADRTLHNGYLGTMVYGLVLDSTPEILFRILPPKRMEVLDVSYDVMYFNTPMATNVPYETAGRLVQHSFSKGGAQMQRKGVGMLIDTETLNTAFGLNMFNAQVQQIKNVVHLTMLGDAMWALIEAATLPRQGLLSPRERFLRQRGLEGRSIEELIEYEIISYATISKNPARGAENIFKDLKNYASENQFAFNAILCGQEMMSYAVKTGQPTDYLVEAYGAREYRPGREGDSTIAGIPVYAMPQLNVYQDTAQIPDLDSQVQIGEFYLAVDPVEMSRGKYYCRSRAERSVMLYNENTDSWEVIDIVDMIENCLRWDDYGQLSAMHDKLAQDPNAMDVFLTKDNGRNVKVEVFGEIEDQYMSYDTLDSVSRSLISNLDEKTRSDVNSLFAVYESLLRGSPSTADVPPYDPANPNSIPMRARHLGYYVKRDGLYSQEELRGHIHELKATEILKAGLLANWYGLEVMAESDGLIARYVDSFIQFTNEIRIKLGDKHPFVDELRCPVHLRDYVKNKVACTLFETVFAYSTTPIIAYYNKPAGTIPGNREVLSEERLTKLIHKVDEALNHADVKKPFMEYLSKVVEITLTNKEKYDELNTSHASPTMEEIKFSLFTHLETLSKDQLKTYVTSLNIDVLDKYLANPNPMTFTDVVTELGKYRHAPSAVDLHRDTETKYDESIDAAGNKVTQEHSQMLLPIVLSSKFVGTFLAEFQQQFTTELISNFKFGVFTPQDDFMTPISPVDKSFSGQFAELLHQLRSTKAYMHRVARVDDKFSPGAKLEHEEYERYTSNFPTERIRGQRAVQNVKRERFDETDARYVGVPPPSTSVYMRQLPAFVKRYRDLAMTSDAALRAAMFCFIVTPVNVHTLKNLATTDSVVPFNFLLLRLMDVHTMGGALAVQGGPDLGAVFFGLDNWTAGVSPETKLFFANYTFHMKALVLRHERCVLVSGMQYKSYNGGHNCTFMTYDDVMHHAQHGWAATPEDCDNDHRDRPSLLCFLVPYTERKMPKFIDATGWMPRADKNKVDPAYSTAHYYNLVCRFSDVHDKVPGFSLFHREVKPTLIAAQGPLRAWSHDHAYDIKGPYSQYGKGHHGREPVPGVTGRERCGMDIARERPIHESRGT